MGFGRFPVVLDDEKQGITVTERVAAEGW